MKAIIRFIAAHNFLPICITFVCYRFFSTLNHHSTDYFYTFGASFFCWLFYWIDKIRDNKNNIFSPCDRHFISDTDKKIQWGIGLLLATITFYHFHVIPLKNLLVFSIAIPVSVFYLILANVSKKFVKELFSSFIISMTLCFIPISMSGEAKNLIVFPLFYLMVLGNMILLGIIDKDYDLKHHFYSIVVSTNQRFAIGILVIVMMTMLTLSLYIGNYQYGLWVLVYCLLYMTILIFRKKSDLNLVHLLADSVFLTPLLFA